MINIKKTLLVGLLLFLSFVSFVQAQSPSPQSSNIIDRKVINETPVNFGYIPQYNFQNAESFNDSITLHNNDPEKATFRVYTVESTLTDRGALTASLESDPRNTNSLIKKIIKLDSSEVTIDAKSNKNLKYKIINDGLQPGTYNGSIVVEKINSNSSSSGASGLTFKLRTVYNFIVVVPGVLQTKYTLSKASVIRENNKYTYIQTITNSGNSLLRFNGEVAVYKDKTSEPLRLDIPENLLPLGSSYTIKKTIPQETFIGSNVFTTYLNIEAYDSKSGVFNKYAIISDAYSFLIIPWEILLGSSIGLFLLLVLIFSKLFVTKKYLKKCRIYTPKDKETLYEIADKFKMSWKKLAKINRIKAPYIIKKGQHLLVRDKSAKSKK